MKIVSGNYSSAQTNLVLVPAMAGRAIRVVRVLFSAWGGARLAFVSNPGADPVVLLPGLHVSANAIVLNLGRAGALVTGPGEALGINTDFQTVAVEHCVTVWYEVV